MVFYMSFHSERQLGVKNNTKLPYAKHLTVNIFVYTVGLGGETFSYVG